MECWRHLPLLKPVLHTGTVKMNRLPSNTFKSRLFSKAALLCPILPHHGGKSRPLLPYSGQNLSSAPSLPSLLPRTRRLLTVLLCTASASLRGGNHPEQTGPLGLVGPGAASACTPLGVPSQAQAPGGDLCSQLWGNLARLPWNLITAEGPNCRQEGNE